MFCFFVNNTTWTFGHLSCTDFDRFWNKRRESVPHTHISEKISEFLHRNFTRPKRQVKLGTSRGFVIRLQLKQHNLWQRESFLGPSRHPSEWILVEDVRFGRYKPTWRTLSAKFHILNLLNYKFQCHSPGGGTLYCVPCYVLCYWL